MMGASTSLSLTKVLASLSVTYIQIVSPGEVEE